MSIGFALAALLVFASAVFTVASTKLVHAVLWLGLMLGATAALFIQLDAPFLAGIQLLLYVGGVMTLMIFGVMLTRRTGNNELRTDTTSPARGAATALALFALMVATIMGTEALAGPMRPVGDTAALGKALLTDHLLSFELISAVLLAAMIGAIVLARRRDPDAPRPEET